MAAAIRHLEGTQAGARSLVISTKISAPPITATLAARPRLRRLITELIANHRVVVVSATAGAGKTTAVVEVVHALEQPVAWLAVDQTDVAPGRLLTYLETAIAGALTEVKGVVGNALAAGLGHVEAAGLLADAVAGAELVLVLDDLERLGDAAEPWSVIDAFLRYAGPNLRTVLISRRDVPAALSAMRPAAGATAAVDEDDLAFTADEAAQALAVLGRDAADAAEVVEATGGWVTGVLFEAWRAAGHVPGTGGGADPLHGYLSAHIVGQLAEADREFLISTSVLDEVTIARAVALGHADAAERIAALQTRRLPVLWRAAPITMRCHPRLREYLHTLLQRREPDAVRSLQIKYATLLAAEGHFEEATEVLLRAGEPQKALAMAERSIFTVIERLDIETADRWLRELSAVAPRGVNVLTEAELMLAFTVGDSIRCVSIVDDLPPEQLERLAAGAGRAGAFAVWALLNCARVDDARGLLAVVPDGPLVEALRYRFWLTQDLEPGGKPVRPRQHDRLFGGLVLITDYFLGRLVDPDDDPASSWGNMVAAPWRIGMVRARGQTQRALELLEQARATSGRAYELTRRMSVDSEVLIDAGRREEARQAIVRMRRLAGYDTSLVSLNALAEVKLLLRLDGDQRAALAVLDRLHATPGARDIAWEAEIADTFYGFALLLEGRDADALAPLRRAVDGMVGGDRILELPTAATYLSEAEWRAGNEDAADRAADVALEAAQRQGSNHLLLQALADVPAVVARRIDAEPAADSAWHALGRILHARGVRLSVHPTSIVRFRDWGERSIEIDGRPARPRVAKSYEVLAYLLAQTDRAADRERLLTAVFDGRGDDSTRAYLRQAIGSLRSVLPDGALTTSPSGPIRISEELAVSSTSGQLESGLAEASRLQGADRLAALQQLIDQMGAGEYLPGGRSGWVDERRERFVGLRTDAQLQAAELAFELGALDRACDLVNAVLEADPYREAGWRLKMRVAAAFGDDDAVIRTYRDLKRALTEIGAAPASGSRKLLDALRR